MTDVASLQDLLESNPGYSRRISGRDPQEDDSHRILSALPPGIEPVAKYSWGLWESGALLGFVDVIRGFPDHQVAYIGLLIVAGGQSRRGLGRRAYQGALNEMYTWNEISVVRLGIVAANAAAAEPFWRSLGFTQTADSKSYINGTVTSTVTVWELPLLAKRPA